MAAASVLSIGLSWEAFWAVIIPIVTTMRNDWLLISKWTWTRTTGCATACRGCWRRSAASASRPRSSSPSARTTRARPSGTSSAAADSSGRCSAPARRSSTAGATSLSGTVLPARLIAAKFPDLVRRISDEGHEVGGARVGPSPLAGPSRPADAGRRSRSSSRAPSSASRGSWAAARGRRRARLARDGDEPPGPGRARVAVRERRPRRGIRPTPNWTATGPRHCRFPRRSRAWRSC